VGGGGEKVTLKLVARYADANNVGGGFESVKRKEETLVRHCETVGRDPAEIERTTNIGAIVIRDSRAEAERVQEELFRRNGNAERWDSPVGTPEDVAEQLAPYLGIGYRHLIAGFPSPYDEETMTRYATEVRALLERALSAPAPRARPSSASGPQSGGVAIASSGAAPVDGHGLRPGAVPGRLGPVAAGRHVAPAAAGASATSRRRPSRRYRSRRT
jgi:hypothetical protein